MEYIVFLSSRKEEKTNLPSSLFFYIFELEKELWVLDKKLTFNLIEAYKLNERRGW